MEAWRWSSALDGEALDGEALGEVSACLTEFGVESIVDTVAVTAFLCGDIPVVRPAAISFGVAAGLAVVCGFFSRE